ncbi:ABC transporter substrate-binding protein [Nocardioides sp. NPDC059952]|uniref:ABC transporter substrate-binding protein n=1 Tax=Nocardioides sp. NPDC059952 TaxID=3347014 RepID=UPI00365D2FB2
MIRTRTHVGRRITIGGLVPVLAISLSACGALGGESESSASDGTVTVWQYYGDEQMPTGKPLYDALEAYDAENDDVKVKIRFIPFEDFNRTLQQGAAAGEGPDVALINAFDTQQMADAGVIEDISDQVEEWGEQDAYYSTSWETTQVDGKTYGIPHVADDYALYYNKDVFEAAGLRPPATWDEMESTAATLATNVKYGLAVSGREGAEGATGILLRQLAAGGDLATFGDGTGAAALESFNRMVDNGGLSKGFLTWLEDDAKTQFAGGNAAMMINSATYVNILRDEVPDLNWGVAPLPKDKASKSFLSAENLTIGAGTGDPDAAWDLIAHLQEQSVLEEYLPARNKLPARDDVPKAVEDPIRKTFADQLEGAWAPEGDVATHSNESLTAIQEALQATVSGSSSPADAATAAQAKIDGALGS